MISLILLIAGLAGVIVSAVYTFKNRISFFKGVVFGTLSWIVSFILSVIYEKAVYGVSPIDYTIELTFSQMRDIISQLPQDVISALSGGAESHEVFMATVLNEVENIKHIYTTLFPAIMIITYAMLVFIIFMFIKNIRKLVKKDVSFIPDFNEIALNKKILLGSVFSILMGFLFSDSVIGNVFANIQLLFSAFIVLSGFSLIDYYFAQKIKLGPVRLIIYAGLIFFGGGLFVFVLQIAAFMAVLDAFRHFRSEKSKWV